MITLSAKNLTKWRDHFCVLSDVSFTLSSGQCLWVRGENGAGKTSLLRILTGLSTSDEGEIYWTDEAVNADNHDYRSAMHYLSHKPSLVSHLTVLETVQLLFPLLGAVNCSDIDIILEDVGLSDQAHQAVQTLSAGQKQRLNLLRLLVRSKPLWILDEPQSHLDQEGQKWLLGIFKKHIQNNGLLLIVSHAEAMDLPNLQSLML